MRQPKLLFLLLLAALLAGLAATRLLIQLPDVQTKAPAGQFDAARAKARLAAILGDERPHPADSAGNDAVRARLLGEIRAIGLNPIVRDQFACNQIYKQRGVTCARVRNVIVALGPTSGKALLLNTHYDSTPVGPAAADAGAGVATLLEVAAILKSERLQRPVLFLFNEGEELGLVGARAFMADPLSRQVDSLINLEARGTTGPVSMFETSLPNGPPLRAFDRSVDRPYANSLATDFYRQLPNYTDVNSFEERGWTTLNFAMIGNETRYHSAGDNLDALDPRSLQHMGNQALAVARELAPAVPQGDSSVLFADIAGRQLIVIPDWLGFALLDLLVAAFAIIAFRRGGIWRALALVIAALAVSAALAWAGTLAMGLLREGQFWRAYPIWTQLAAYACGIAGAVAALAFVGRRLAIRQLRTGYWLAFLLIGVVILFIAPGGAIFFILPPLAMLAGIAAKRLLAPVERVGAIVAALLLWLTLGEVLALLGDLMVSGPFFIFALLAAILVLPWLIEARSLIESSGRWAATATAALVMLAAWGAVGAAPAYSADRQQRFTIQHVTDTTGGQQFWSVANDQALLPDAYGGHTDWRWAALPYGERKRWLAEAPAVDGLEPPRIIVTRRSISAGRRTIDFRIEPNGAESVTLTAPEESGFVSAGSGDFVRPFAGGAEGDYHFTCFGRRCGGAELQVTTADAKPVVLTLTGFRRGLPDSARPLVEQRPDNARPQYAADSTITLSRIRL